jgi:hypothetical protein
MIYTCPTHPTTTRIDGEMAVFDHIKAGPYCHHGSITDENGLAFNPLISLAEAVVEWSPTDCTICNIDTMDATEAEQIAGHMDGCPVVQAKIVMRVWGGVKA